MDTVLALSIAALAISGATALIGGWQVFVLRKQVSSTQQANMYAEFRDVRWDPVEYDFLLGNEGLLSPETFVSGWRPATRLRALSSFRPCRRALFSTQRSA
jgi:hypothetical protein